jgi:dTMP kinase
MTKQAPFVPSNVADGPIPKNIWAAFRQYGYWRVFVAQFVSSLGDWIGIFAIIAIASRVSNNSGYAVALPMLVRIVPGLFLASIGGLLVDRLDRRKIMVICDISRALLLFALPFWNSLWGLIVISFFLEMFTLLWGPAKDSSIPYLITPTHLDTANSLGLACAYGTFPLGAIVFGAMSGVGAFIGARADFIGDRGREFAALWADGLTYLISAIAIFSLTRVFRDIRRNQVERMDAEKKEKQKHLDDDALKKKINIAGTFAEIKNGYKFIAKERLVRGIMLGLGVGIIGGGVLVPLGKIYATTVLGGGDGTYSLLMIGLGTGAAIGIITLLFIQKYLKRGTVFWSAIVLCGVSLVIVALSGYTWLSVLAIGGVGGFAGSGYVTGFTVLQEEVEDNLRGRTFAALYTIVRICMIFALAVSPLFSDFYDWLLRKIFGTTRLSIASFDYNFPGVRVTLLAGGLIIIVGGLIARSQVVHKEKSKAHPAVIAEEKLNEAVSK